MYGPARLASQHRRKMQRRRARLAARPAHRGITVAVAGSAATAPAWTPPPGLPDAGLTTSNSNRRDGQN